MIPCKFPRVQLILTIKQWFLRRQREKNQKRLWNSSWKRCESPDKPAKWNWINSWEFFYSSWALKVIKFSVWKWIWVRVTRVVECCQGTRKFIAKLFSSALIWNILHRQILVFSQSGEYVNSESPIFRVSPGRTPQYHHLQIRFPRYCNIPDATSAKTTSSLTQWCLIWLFVSPRISKRREGRTTSLQFNLADFVVLFRLFDSHIKHKHCQGENPVRESVLSGPEE